MRFAFELELRERASCATFVLTNCDFAAGALGMLFARYFCTLNVQAFSRSCGNVLCVLLLYLRVAIFQLELQERASRTTSYVDGAIAHQELWECASCSTFVLKICDFAPDSSHTTFVDQKCNS